MELYAVLNTKIDHYRTTQANRPFGNLEYLVIGVDGNPLRKGDQVIIKWGDKSDGGPGTKAPIVSREYGFPILVDADGDSGFGKIKDSPSFRVVGKAACRFHIVMPTIIEKNKNVTVKVVAVDEHGNIDPNFRGRIVFSSTDDAANLPSSYSFRKSDGGRHEFSIKFNTEGIHYVDIIGKSISGRSNPGKVMSEAPKNSIYWGDIHSHTKNCDGTPAVDEGWIYARDVSCLDFAAISTHITFPSFIEDDEWEWLCSRVRNYNNDGKFVAIHGFELDRVGGHKNIYWPDDNPPKSLKRFLEIKSRGGGPEEFWAYLKELGVFAIPHHPAGSFPAGVEWNWSNDEVIPLIEITQCQGTAEYFGNANQQMAARKGYSAQDGLAMGFKFGFMGSSDFHEIPCGSLIELNDIKYIRWHRVAHQFQGGGITGVYAPELKRDEIYDRMRSRYCYATTGERILVEFNMDGHRMGSEYKTNEPPKIEVTVAGTAPLNMIELVKNNDTIYRIGRSSGLNDYFENDITYSASFSINDESYKPSEHWDYYYIRVTQRNGEMAWSSPIWVSEM